ncbi:epithelial cell adhesion molecule [Cyclopterus lumpus]|uniref:Epithelial cell adhesion molecule n=1 Tax=Cyclopterus lumpus TaxID=8103 RepID=A0A8C3AWH9_CYCLU|nr:epithelial cell adhesion molecule [Cyclopterus lumpus]
MIMWIALVVVAFAAKAAAVPCACETLKWATCEEPCDCTVFVGVNMKQKLDCKALIPKCYLMKAEMHQLKTGGDGRLIGGKPVESAFVDNDGIYDPVCENDGTFKAKQCNNTAECWCVNSAGVRRTDKGDENLKCEKLVETNWVRLQLTHKPLKTPLKTQNLKAALSEAMNKRYGNFNKDLVKDVQYDADSRMIVVDVKKPKGDRQNDLTNMAYYMEKDVKVLPLFKNSAKFEPAVDGQNLEMDNILVYYVDEEPPTFTMKHLSGGIIAVIVVVVLAVVAGLLVLFFARRRQNQKYNKAQQRELDPM